MQGYVSYTAQQQGITEDQVIAGITGNMPLGEIPADEDVAETVAFFLSDRAPHDHGPEHLRERRRVDALNLCPCAIALLRRRDRAPEAQCGQDAKRPAPPGSPIPGAGCFCTGALCLP